MIGNCDFCYENNREVGELDEGSKIYVACRTCLLQALAQTKPEAQSNKDRSEGP